MSTPSIDPYHSGSPQDVKSASHISEIAMFYRIHWARIAFLLLVILVLIILIVVLSKPNLNGQWENADKENIVIDYNPLTDKVELTVNQEKYEGKAFGKYVVFGEENQLLIYENVNSILLNGVTYYKV